MKILYKRSKSIADYDVYADGVFIGTLRKFEQRYNLRRVILVRGWRATTPTDEKLYSTSGHNGETRAEAAQALVKRATSKAALVKRATSKAAT